MRNFALNEAVLLKKIKQKRKRERYYMNSRIPYVDAQYNSYVSMISSTFET